MKTRAATTLGALVLVTGFLISTSLRAAGPFSSPVTLDPLMMNGTTLSFSVKDYTLETGKYYKWHVEGDGVETFVLQAPELFRNSWLTLLVVNAANCPTERCDVEIQPGSAIYGIQFDDPGAIDIYFVPLRGGEYEFHAKGFESRGLTGKFHVR